MGVLDTIGKAFSPAYLFNRAGKGQQNPANAAQPYLNQVGPMAQGQLNPFIARGHEAIGQNAPQYNKMASNPVDFLRELEATYTPSEGFKFRQEQARKGLRGSAAAGGYSTTEAGRLGEEELLDKMLQGDMGDYINRVLGIQQTGLQGNELAAQRGFSSASDLINILGSVLGTQAGLGYQAQAAENLKKQERQRIFAQLFGGVAGGLVGGPAGASIGSSLGGSFGGGRGPSLTDMFHVAGAG